MINFTMKEPMPKYRIVKRTGAHSKLNYYSGPVYFAQRKLFDLFWVDCEHIDMEQCTRTYDRDMAVVQRYIEGKLHKYHAPVEEVVETFYEGEE